MNTNNLRSGSNFYTISGMRHNSQQGYIDTLLIPLIVVGVLLITAIGFGGWAYSSRSDYKNNAEKKIADAVAATTQATQKADAAQYAEEAKSPLKTHVGPESFGSVSVQYPKTWSVYVIENTSNSGGTPMNNYYSPDVVSNVATQSNAYALRVQILQVSYNSAMAQFSGLVAAKKVTVSPYNLPKVPNVIGSRIDGQIAANKQGSMIILPLRNMALQISTEAPVYLDDFNKTILPNLTFSP
jgi:hypothetical protein